MRRGSQHVSARRALRASAITLLWTIHAAPAAALDDSNPTGLITETVASRDHLRRYDGAKKYSAERVSDRTRKHVQPQGLRIGNFMFFPATEVRAIYDDNIFAARQNAVDDLRTEIAPSLVIKSQLPRHILNFAFDGRFVNFAENGDQDYADARASFDGALHIDHAHTLAASMFVRRGHEERGALTASRTAREPVAIDHARASIGLTRDTGRLYGTWSATVDRYDYHDVASIDGATLDQDVRDRDIFSTQVRTAYRFSPGYEAVAKMRLLRQLNGADEATDLDATGYEGLVGVAFETSPLLRWRLLGGYGVRDYDANIREKSGTALIEGHVEWLPTQKMTLYGTVAREFNDYAGEGFTGWIETSLKGRMEYEIYNNIVLKFGANFRHADFEGQDREDRIYSGTAGLEYFMNKNWLFTFSYEHEFRESNEDAFDMSRNKFMIGAKLRF